MRAYLDASVCVPLFTADALSGRADAYFESRTPTILLSDFVSAEFASVVARKTRTGELSMSEARSVFANFDAWVAEQAARVPVTSADIMASEAFIRRLDLNLRAPDAIHIAMAMRMDVELATFDDRMADAARALGCAVAAL